MDFITFLMLLCVSGMVYAIYLFFFTKNDDSAKPEYAVRKEANPVKKQIALETISVLWAKRVDFSIPLNELCRVWRDNIPEPEAAIEFDTNFSHPEVADFYERHVNNKAYFSGNVKKATVKILDLLDKMGDCPSVVQGQGETESQMPRSAYDTLAKVPLYEHTINVAREIVAVVNEGPLLPKAILAALAHDLGKIPVFREKLYATGDHPLMSIVVLNDVPGFKFISYAEEIITAIKGHHRTVAKDKRSFLEEKLKEADQAARRNEMSRDMTSSNILADVGFLKPTEPPQTPSTAAVSAGSILDSIKAAGAQAAGQTAAASTGPATPLTLQRAPEPAPATGAPPAVTSAPAAAPPLFAPPATSVPEPAAAVAPPPVVAAPPAPPLFGAPQAPPGPAAGGPEPAIAPPAVPAPATAGEPETARPGRGPKAPAPPVDDNRQSPFADLAAELTVPAGGEQVDFFGAYVEEDKTKVVPRERYLDWFNCDEFLKEVGEHVNKLYGNRWVAFSMPSGVVYIQTTTVMEALKKLGKRKKIPDIAIAETDEELRKSLLYSAYLQLRNDRGAIAKGLIRDGFFSGYFTVRMKDGREYKKHSYMPFLAEAFANTVSELEAKKFGKLKDIAEVVPYTDKG